MTKAKGELKKAVQKKVDEISDDLEAIGRKIFESPEIKFEEHQAVRWLTESLNQSGFSVNTGLAGMDTAFEATCKKSSDGPTIAYLCEYDALPKLGHGCGHNLIAAIGLGAGIALCSVMDKLGGTLKVIGTPAEEGGGGKVDMVKAGVFDDLDAAMMVHPSDLSLIGQSSLAVQEIMMDFYGKSAHASAEPEKGINALDAAINTFNNINAFRQQMKDGARIHGIITDGGEKPNIVPEHAGAYFYVRAADGQYLEDLLERVKDCAKAGALAAGAEVEFDTSGHAYRPMDPNPVLVDLYKNNFESLGEEMDEPEGGLGSTDMGDVSQVVPSIHGYVQIADKDTPGHSWEFVEASNSERGYRAMVKAAKALAMTGVDLLSDPSVVDKAWEEFRANPSW